MKCNTLIFQWDGSGDGNFKVECCLVIIIIIIIIIIIMIIIIIILYLMRVT